MTKEPSALPTNTPGLLLGYYTQRCLSKTFQVVKREQQSRWLEGMKAPRAAHSPRDTAVARWKIAFSSLRTTHLYRSAYVLVKARFSRSVRYSFSGLNHEADACHVREDGERVSGFSDNCRAWHPRSNQISAPIAAAILNIFFFRLVQKCVGVGLSTFDHARQPLARVLPRDIRVSWRGFA